MMQSQESTDEAELGDSFQPLEVNAALPYVTRPNSIPENDFDDEMVWRKFNLNETYLHSNCDAHCDLLCCTVVVHAVGPTIPIPRPHRHRQAEEQHEAQISLLELHGG